jgi:hypothetical protein
MWWPAVTGLEKPFEQIAFTERVEAASPADKNIYTYA